MEFRNFDPRHTGELLKHMDRQNEVLMEAYRSIFHELRKLQVEEEMLMRKMHEIVLPHGVTARVDKKEPVAPEAILATRDEQRNGKTIWEAAETIKEKFPSFHLEDKAETREDGIDGNPLPIVLAQPTSEKTLLVYTRRSKAYVPETSTSFR
ncbi:uncharacterized protein LOC106762388 isoform X1 [Vigna radiata var. radiata]|uniref:Uncharacterized protein LOC106762388 isoform X1 n=1 Tax=Vigna radiata var. radiata TaxID=3916 RepID=A0A1S3U6W1_VIGRR|nr:uncharacterized protein LOC106762388 isoform X1 [Vigna radiata var. radiata]XP_014501765.1 uncharacterized protein LOC106762388 isoform X1 [Vigna radiata var. radiata]